MAEDEQAWVQQRLDRWRASRDNEALGELLKWQRDRAYAVAVRIVGCAEAEDAVQQAFIKLLSRTHGFEDAGSFRSAVFRAVIQAAIDLARLRRSEGQREKAMRQTENHPPQPHAVAERAEALRLVHEELGKLDEPDRAAVVLCCQEGLSVYHAAEALDVPRETLRYRLTSTLNRLRSSLAKRGLPLTLLVLSDTMRAGTPAGPTSLVAALDRLLPGQPCAAVPPAQPLAVPPEAFAALSSPSAPGIAAKIASPKFIVAAAGILLAALAGIGLWRFAGGAQKAGQQPPPDANTAAQPMVIRPSSKNAVQPAAGAPKPDTVKNPIFDGIPDEVVVAASRAVKGIVLIGVKKEHEDGKLVYEFAGEAAGIVYEIDVSPEGVVLEVEKADQEEGKQPRAEPPPSPKGDF